MDAVPSMIIGYEISSTEGGRVSVRGTAVPSPDGAVDLAVRRIDVPGYTAVYVIDHVATGLAIACFWSREVALDIASRIGDRMRPIRRAIHGQAAPKRLLGVELYRRIVHHYARDCMGRKLTIPAEEGAPA